VSWIKVLFDLEDGYRSHRSQNDNEKKECRKVNKDPRKLLTELQFIISRP
jgi:hypothetical protein